MAVALARHKLAYFPIPKTACTSIKMMMFELEHGRKFEMYEKEGVLMHIHNAAYPTPKFLDTDLAALTSMQRIAVVRDPVKRMLSAYSNRVNHHGELSEAHINTDLAQALGVHPNPSPDHFFNNLEKFRVLSPSIQHHTDPVNVFLGPDLHYFHRVFRLENLDDFVEFVATQTEQAVHLGREQTGGEKVEFHDLGSRAQRSLLEYTYAEYALLRGHYVPPTPS